MIEPRLKEAMDWHTAGEFDKAWDRYSELERENPEDANVIHLMGVLAGQVGNLLESVARINRAVKLNPASSDFHKNLSITHRRLGDKGKAAEAMINMGNVLTDQNRMAEAIDAFAQAAELDPRNEHAVNNLGVTLNRLGRYPEARDVLTKALAANPRMPRQLANWDGESLPGGFLQQLPSVHLNLGNAHIGLGYLDEAIASHRRALQLNPGLIEGHNDFAIALLLAGQYEEAWREFEWRWQDEKYTTADFKVPRWNGESAAELGGKILVLSEQGFGDGIMLCRYLQLMVDAGHEIIFEVKPELWHLFSEGLASDRIKLVPAASSAQGYDDLDIAAYTGTFSLPRIFGTTIETIPAAVPYISVSEERRARWQKKLHSPLPGGEAGHPAGWAGEGTNSNQSPHPNPLPRGEGKIKVGIVWGGNPLHLKNFERSMPPEFLHDLVARDDVAFYSLQKGPAASYPFPRGHVTVLDADLTDFAETAAAIEALDLVIGVDTAVMHLVGALGKPAWMLLAHVPDWRWLMGRDTSPWYPTARLFRQQKYGDWKSAVDAATHALDQLVRAR